MSEPESKKSFVTTESQITPEQFNQWVEDRREEEKRDPNLRLKRLRQESDYFARMARHHRRDAPEVQRQEQLIRDMRGIALRELELATFDVRQFGVDEVADELNGRVVQIKSRLWYTDLPIHKHRGDLELSREEFEKAVWEETWPSLTERVISEATRLKSKASKRFSTNVRVLRESCGWTQDDLCEKAEIPSKRRVGEYESGHKRPDPSRLKALADAFSKELSIVPPLTSYELLSKDVKAILEVRRKAPQ